MYPAAYPWMMVLQMFLLLLLPIIVAVVFLTFRAAKPNEIDYRFVRFRPPAAIRSEDGSLLPPPHIRLDRALQFLLGDRLG